MVTIKDPIHGLIHLEGKFQDIVQHPLFIRLKYIKQLSLAHLVYPGATHTRYQHSIGVYGLTDKFFRMFTRSFKNDIDLKEIESVKMYALLHDIGHISFSHDSEAVLSIMNNKLTYNYENTSITINEEYTHEKFGEKLISIISSELDLDDYSIKNYNIISDEIGFDRLDYLVRDAYYTGTTYGIIDEYVLDLIKYKTGGNIELDIENGSSKNKRTIESILIARYMMFNNVYHHNTIIKAAAILRKLLYMALEYDVITFQDLVDAGDEAILWKLSNLDQNKYKKIRDLARDLWYRRLNKYTFKNTDVEDFDNKKILEYMECDDLFIYWTKGKKVDKRFIRHLGGSKFISLIDQLSKDQYLLIEVKN